MSIRDLKKTELLSKVEALKKGGVLLPNDLLEKVDSINEKWELEDGSDLRCLDTGEP